METEEFCIKLQKLLNEHHVSQEGLAAMTGIRETAIKRFCAGERMPNPEAQNAIADALGIPHEDIMQLADNADPWKILREECPF